MPAMNRREALKTGAVALGGIAMLSSGVLAACARDNRPPTTGILSRDEEDLAESVADTILPKTAASPGAKEANAGQEINLLVTDCYEPDAQQRLRTGLKAFDAQCRDKYQKPFTELPRADREALLRTVEAAGKKAPPDTHWFPLMREVSERAYFSSQIGMTQALRYIQVPGKWVGCMPLAPGQRAWG
jgi:glucoside 3-dehydrogenase (cytochrome c) hitch-hiker subunit